MTQQDVQAYLTMFKTPERLEKTVKMGLYPPSIEYRFAYKHIPIFDSFSLRMVSINIDGTDKGRVSYPCDVYDSPKGVFLSSTYHSVYVYAYIHAKHLCIYHVVYISL